MSDAASRAVAYETGQVDILPAGSIENFDIDRVKELPNTCITQSGWEFFGPQSWVWLNNRQGPTASKEFRQAIMYALDREFIRDSLFNGLGQIPNGPFAGSTRYNDTDLKPWPYDPKKAKELVKASGYKGEVLKLVPMPYGETWMRLAEVIKHNNGDYTFAQAFERSGRAVNVSISPTRTRQKPRVLNHLTTPDVTLLSAAVASARCRGPSHPPCSWSASWTATMSPTCRASCGSTARSRATCRCGASAGSTT